MQKGQALTEYLLIIALISVIVIAVVNRFGGYLQDKLTKFSCEIMETEYVPGAKPGGGTCKSEYE